MIRLFMKLVAFFFFFLSVCVVLVQIIYVLKPNYNEKYFKDFWSFIQVGNTTM